MCACTPHMCSGAFLKSLAVSSSKCLITLGRNCCTEPGFSETSRVNIITMMKLKKKSINCYSAGGVTGEKMSGERQTEGFCPLQVYLFTKLAISEAASLIQLSWHLKTELFGLECGINLKTTASCWVCRELEGKVLKKLRCLRYSSYLIFLSSVHSKCIILSKYKELNATRPHPPAF